LQIKVLEVLLEKDLKSSQRQELLLALQEQNDVRHTPGGVDALRHLILRLDINEWWKNLISQYECYNAICSDSSNIT
jgi:hypothetical protein